MSGLQAKPHRGPICFDCPYESSPLNCTKVTVCEKGEVYYFSLFVCLSYKVVYFLN